MPQELSAELARLLTEQRNPASMTLDVLSTEGVLRLINAQDKLVPVAVEREIPYIARAVEIVVEAFRSGGRLIYTGAGTSGRLGIVDASECPPTFGTDPSQVVGVIAGGRAAVFSSQEGAEDNMEQAVRDLQAIALSPRDVVCGIAASRRTPFVVSSVRYARSIGARTLYVSGAEDARGGPPPLMQALAAKVPGARHASVPGASHIANIQNPAGFNRVVADFLTEA